MSQGPDELHSAIVTQPFVPLRVFSSFTMLEGAMEPKTIAERAAKLGFPAVALADRNGLYGVMPFSEACFGKGVQPMIGTMLAVARPPEMGGEAGIDWLALLAQDDQGYANLCKLVSSAHLDRPAEQEPHVEFEKLRTLSSGLIALTAGGEGALAKLIADGQHLKAEAYLDLLQVLFPERLYVELSRRGDPVEDASEITLIDLAYARDLPLVATNPAAYADPSFHALHQELAPVIGGKSNRCPSKRSCDDRCSSFTPRKCAAASARVAAAIFPRAVAARARIRTV